MRLRSPRVNVCMECVDYDRSMSVCQCGRSLMYHVQIDAFSTACKMYMSVRSAFPPRKKRKKIESVYDYE